jgi:cell division protein FtsB
MNKKLITGFFLLVLLFSSSLVLGGNQIDSLLNVLDRTVADQAKYEHLKEQKLSHLRDLLSVATTDALKYPIYGRLFNEYWSYRSDTALFYAEKKLEIARRMDNKKNINDAKLNIASVMMLVGMYKEAMDTLSTVNMKYSPDLKAYSYFIYRTLYGYLGDYSISAKEKTRYQHLTAMYRDSLLIANAPNSSAYIMVKSDKLIVNHQYDDALNLLKSYYPSLPPDSHDRAIIAYSMAMAYKGKKELKKEEKWLIVSSIYDLQSDTKEYVSLRDLAYMLYENGDIARASKYIKRSLEDALFCNARLRTVEISRILPIINRAYQIETNARQRQLYFFLICISILSLFLLISLIFRYQQMKKLIRMEKNLSQANQQMKALNQELFKTNDQLTKANATLTEANLIKEEYIGRYMDQCSMYIDKLDEYRHSLKKQAATGKVSDLLSAIKSSEFIEDELKEFYSNFDATFLQLFPNFIEEFNLLLEKDKAIIPKPGELLNTELRIFALIRLGITDSVKISHFLRYSLSTIYNYRTKIRNKAVCPRDEFEAMVMKIGTKM